MALVAMQSNEVHEYICKDDPCKTKEDGATVFYLHPIANAVMTRISDQIQTASMNYGDMQTQTFQQRTNHRNRECFRFACKGWDNFPMPDGTMLEYASEVVMEGGVTYNVVAGHCLDLIYGNIIQEVGAEAWNRNTMTETQRKNFEAWSSRLGASPTSNAENAKSRTGSKGAAKKQRGGSPKGSKKTASELITEAEGLPEGAAILANPKSAPTRGGKP